MTIQEILDYIAKTPENANVNVLSGMLDELTSGGGEEGGGDITVEALSVTENGTYTAESGKAYSPVTVNVPSDYSTAEVTFINSSETPNSPYYVLTPQVVDDPVSTIIQSYIAVDAGSSETVLIPLYKGSFIMSATINIRQVSQATPPVVTGGVAFDTSSGTPMINITGDGTFTAAGEASST